MRFWNLPTALQHNWKNSSTKAKTHQFNKQISSRERHSGMGETGEWTTGRSGIIPQTKNRFQGSVLSAAIMAPTGWHQGAEIVVAQHAKMGAAGFPNDNLGQPQWEKPSPAQASNQPILQCEIQNKLSHATPKGFSIDLPTLVMSLQNRANIWQPASEQWKITPSNPATPSQPSSTADHSASGSAKVGSSTPPINKIGLLARSQKTFETLKSSCGSGNFRNQKYWGFGMFGTVDCGWPSTKSTLKTAFGEPTCFHALLSDHVIPFLVWVWGQIVNPNSSCLSLFTCFAW